jgi:hypothetical protein
MSFLDELVTMGRSLDPLANLGSMAMPCLGIVSENEDPDGLCRIKVTLPNGQLTDWVPVVVSGYGIYFDPYPIGTTVLIVFASGEPTKPIATGILVNRLNPPQDGPGTRILATRVSVTSDQMETTAATVENKVSGSISTMAPTVKHTGASSYQINSKEVVVLGGKDTDNDTINYRGY